MSRCGALASERPKATFGDKNLEQVSPGLTCALKKRIPARLARQSMLPTWLQQSALCAYRQEVRSASSGCPPCRIWARLLKGGSVEQHREVLERDVAKQALAGDGCRLHRPSRCTPTEPA